MRGFVVGALVALLCVPVGARAADGDRPCPPGAAPNPSGLACVFLDKTTTGLETVIGQTPPDDPWLTTALELQHRLGDALPLRDAMWVGTHNSFNTISNSPPSLSNTDHNQHLSLVDQLDIGIRSIEIDIHWILNRVVVCHGLDESQFNAGCTFERVLADELPPVGEWVRAHPGDVVLIYVEDDLTSAPGFDAAAQAVSDTIGELVYAPPAGGDCTLLPLSLRRADVLAAGKQIVVMSGCGTDAWNSVVFDDSVRSEDGNPDFAGYRACTSTDGVAASDYGSKLVRFYEDSTFVSTAAAGGDPGDRFTVDGVRDMVRCGVNLFGLDEVDPGDPRLAAMVWSWGDGEPVAGGQCAVDDGSFHAAPCGELHPYACVAGSDWHVTAAVGPQDAGAEACAAEFPGTTFAVPGSGAHAQALRDVEPGAVWLAYTLTSNGWSGAAA